MNKLKQNEKELKQKLINSMMNSGNKNSVERILLKSLKLTQKINKKNIIGLLKQAVIRSTPTFKINNQIIKKGKRKRKLETLSFIKTESNRIILSLKFLIKIISKNQELATFSKKFADEIISKDSKSKALEYKNTIQKQVLVKKRYIHKFRW